MVEFGSVQKLLDEVHPDTGLPTLVAATKARIEAALQGEYAGLVVVFGVHPTHGLTYTFRGPEPEVEAVLATLGIGPASRFSLQGLPSKSDSSENQIAASTREAHMDDPKQTEDPKPGSEKPSDTKPIVDQVTDVAADAAAELASTAVKALAEGAKKAIKKRTPKPITKAVAAVNKAAAKTRAKKAKSKKATARATKTAARRTTKTKTSKTAVAKRAKAASKKTGKKSSTKSRKKRSKSRR